MNSIAEGRKAAALERLQDWLKPGDTVHTVIRSVARSGMSRRLDLYKLEAGEPRYLTRNVADALRWTFPKTGEGLRVDGCGMDMGFHVVYTLAATLFPEGFECVGKDCPSCDHSNGDRVETPHQHRDGGYALRQRWL